MSSTVPQGTHRFAGFDVSTQGCKLVVVEPERGQTVFVESLNYDRDLPHYETLNGTARDLGTKVSESDPRMWIEAVEILLERLSIADFDLTTIRAISVAGQQHGLVALDGAGNLTRARSKLWNDYSTRQECRLLTDAVGGHDAMIQAVGNSQRSGYTAPKILHMVRHEAAAYAATSVFLVVHNYINWWLTGGVAVMEPGDASGTALWDPRRGAWSAAVVSAVAPDLADKLPAVARADRFIGTVAPALAERFGLSPACQIDAGSGDNMYAAVGTGNYRPGVVTISLGTSGTAAVIRDEPFVDPSGEIASYCDSTGRYLSLVCVSNMANGYNAVLRRFDLDHAAFDRMLAETPAGNDGRLLLPWYAGERTPDLPDAAPVYFGFGVDDFGAARLGRAVLEGHVHNLHSGFRKLPGKPKCLRLTGGLSQSPSWCQTLADVFDVEAIPVRGEGAALGAAIHAGWVWLRSHGLASTIDEVGDALVELDRQGACRPDPARAATYRLQSALFDALSARVRGLPGEDPMELREALLRAN